MSAEPMRSESLRSESLRSESPRRAPMAVPPFRPRVAPARREPPKPELWFVTAQFARPPEGALYDYEPVASSVAHAKTWGTNLTACGLDCSSWFKLWGTPFRLEGYERCPECESVVFGEPESTAPEPCRCEGPFGEEVTVED